MNSLIAALPIISLILLGYILKKFNFFKEQTVKEIKNFVSNITLPALLVNAFLALEIESRYLIMIPVVTILCFVMVFIGNLVKRIGRIETPYFPLLMAGFEMGMFGYAIFFSFYGQENFPKIAFLSLGQSIFIFTYVISKMKSIQNGKDSIIEVIKRFVSSPIVISIITGVVLGSFKGVVTVTPFLKSIHSFIILLGSITVPLISITIGYGLKISKKGLKLSIITILVRKSVLLVFALLINHYIIDSLLHMPYIYQISFLFIMIAPPPFLYSAFCDQNDRENVAYIDQTVSLDCIVSIISSMIIVLVV
ncbi:MAG: permease [Spirochaetia bacterium]|nr:permease [Spirochaetia bacterium]